MALLTGILPSSRRLSAFRRRSAIVTWTGLARETPSCAGEWKSYYRLTNSQAISLADQPQTGQQEQLKRFRREKNRATALAITSCCNRLVRADAEWFTWLNRRHPSEDVLRSKLSSREWTRKT